MPSHYLSNPNFRTRIADQRARDDALIYPQVFGVANAPAPYLPPTQLPGQGLGAPAAAPGPIRVAGDGGPDPADSETFDGGPLTLEKGLTTVGNALGFMGPQAVLSIGAAIANPKSLSMSPVMAVAKALGIGGSDPGDPGASGMVADPAGQIGASASGMAPGLVGAGFGDVDVGSGFGRGPDSGPGAGGGKQGSNVGGGFGGRGGAGGGEGK